MTAINSKTATRPRFLQPFIPEPCTVRAPPVCGTPVDRRAASRPRSQYVDLAAWRERVEAVLDQPSDRQQATRRPPRADHVEVDVGAVAGDDVAQVLLVSERQDGEVVERIALARLGPVGTPVISSPSTNTSVICRSPCDEHRGVRPGHSLRDLAGARDQVGGKAPVVISSSHSSSRLVADSAPRLLGHGGSGASCSRRTAAPAAAHADDDAIDGSPSRPSAVPGRRRSRAPAASATAPPGSGSAP